MRRFSYQREAILTNLRCRVDHPTAETIYLDLRKDYPNISLGTIYRNLTELSEEGAILRIQDGEKDHFDGNNSMHFHFFCDKCKGIFDVFGMKNISKDMDFVKKALDCDIKNVNLLMHGTCSSCKSK